MANADEKVKLIDTIQYKGLVPNLKYTATGTLMDAKTGEPVLINDKRVTTKTTFTPETSSGTVDVALYSYAEFDSIDTSDRYRLMDMSARNGNRDGAALRFVAEHLAKRPEKQKLLIIISDGQPADTGYYGTEAEDLGFSNHTYFYKIFKAQYGVTPKAYREKYKHSEQ